MIELSREVKQIADSIPIAHQHIAELTQQILDICAQRKLKISGKIVAGLDVNGPIVSCSDSDLIPFKGAIEAIDHLMRQQDVEVTLMTGWDLTTMSFFRKDRLKIPIGIVGEYGMAYELNGQTRHLYPYNENEANTFVSTVLTAAAENQLKVAFQGNVSPGAGAVYFEGDKNGNLLNHALVKGRRPTIAQIYEAIVPESQARLEGERIIFTNRPENMKGFYKALLRKHPLISVRVKPEGDQLSIAIDENDRPGFTFEDLKKVGERAKVVTGRDILVYEDFGVDFMSPKVKEGNYSKDSGLRAYGREAFGGNDFLPVIIGDKKSDIPKKTENTLMCALKGSDAEPVVRGMTQLAAVYPNDVRDFALALAEAHRIANGKKVKTFTPKRSAAMPNAFTSLLTLSPTEKKAKGVEFTPAEIFQQPQAWRRTYEILEKQKTQIKAFFKGQQKKRTILLSGAGTSAFIGLCLEPLYNRVSGFNTKAVPTTDVITDPNAAFRKGEKYILFHFARSGNSPESVGTFTLAEESKADIKHVVITCNKDGKLAKMGKKRNALLILLPPETNDKSLAMTSSFSSMVVAAEYIATLLSGADYGPIVEKQARAAEFVMNNYGDQLNDACIKGFTRAVFMGSNTLQGCAKECHLKCQEETDGRVVAKHDSFLGLRHGPEAVINKETLVVYLLSEETLTRKYELDMMYGIKGKGIGQTRLAFCRKADGMVRNAADIVVEYKEEIPDDYLTPVGVLMGQMLGVLRSLSYGLKPDSPSVAGVISRVVQGVKIYDRPRFYKKGDYKVIAG